MNCSPKTMLKVAAVLGAILVVTYFAVPEAQALVLAGAPVLLALICPVMMLVMAFTMKGRAGSGSCEAAPREAGARAGPRDVDPGEGWPGPAARGEPANDAVGPRQALPG